MASPVDTSVKHFYSAMAGAPAVSGTAGSLISALDACLVSGFGAKAVDSAVISGGVCRMSFASGVSAAKQEAVILVTGASPAALNGEQKVTAVATAWVEFKTDLPDGAVTGSISFKLAPLGWEKVFSKTNVAVYRPTDPASSRPYIRVDDTNAVFARVQMYESMTDVDTGMGVTPTTAGGWYWHKWSSAAATATYWLVIGDSRGFYFLNNLIGATAASQGQSAATSRYAGDLNSYRSGDAWCALLTGINSASYNTVVGCVFSSLSGGFQLMRASTGIGGAVSCERLVFGGSNSISGIDGTSGSFPSRADNGLRLSTIQITDGVTANGPRGEMPGAFYCPQSGVPAAIGADVVLTQGSAQFAGKTVLSLSVGSPNGSPSGIGFFDVTGPWREG
ncbi:hypothetical protein N5F13_00435 [Comamonas thiooxydans]|uniref:hypothetical protein n=1 Tax=Comamonas thiooxydans TaxID=363952 RepID=UPI00244C0781|nr:hypothetical protein [Comamonas thiooxydans]MDH1472948.1 hypothetical protein [Comamonas thiooxydans]